MQAVQLDGMLALGGADAPAVLRLSISRRGPHLQNVRYAARQPPTRSVVTVICSRTATKHHMTLQGAARGSRGIPPGHP